MEGSPADQAPATPFGLPAMGRRGRTGLFLVPVAVYSWFASATTPFTLAADVTTAVPILGMVVVYLLQRRRPDGPWRRLPSDHPPAGGTPIPWLAVVALLVASELASFFGGARATHPTLSTLTNTIFRWHAAKAAVYFVWVSLSWYFLRR